MTTGIVGKKMWDAKKRYGADDGAGEADSAAEVGQIGWRMLGDAAEK